jgi:hypothetical protein
MALNAEVGDDTFRAEQERINADVERARGKCRDISLRRHWDGTPWTESYEKDFDDADHKRRWKEAKQFGKGFATLQLVGYMTNWLMDILAASKKAILAHHDRLDDLAQRVQDLEDKGVVHDAGKWMEGTTYSPGALVTRGGSFWLCKHATMSRPGTHPDDWRLVAKGDH